MVLGGHRNRSSDNLFDQLERRDRDSGVTWDHVITAALLVWFFLGTAIIFADLWIPIIPYLRHGPEVIGDPVLFMLSLVLFLSILWNVTFYLNKRKELRVARKLIKWVASQGIVVTRTNKERERIDRVLLTAIWALRNGENPLLVVNNLNEGTCDGEVLPNGWARSYFDTTIKYLMDATDREQVLAWDEYKRVLLEGELNLWATRAESLRK